MTLEPYLLWHDGLSQAASSDLAALKVARSLRQAAASLSAGCMFP